MAIKRSDVIAMYRSGMSYAAIAKEVGVSRQRIQFIVRPAQPIYNALKQRAAGCCEKCGIAVKSGHAHHVDNHPAADVSDISNLLFLCPTCHRMEHLGDKRNGIPPVHTDKPNAITHDEMLDILRKYVHRKPRIAVARQLGISTSYLDDVLSGEKQVTAMISRKLGYEREVTRKYEYFKKDEYARVAQLDRANPS